MSHGNDFTKLLGLQGWRLGDDCFRVSDEEVFVAIEREPGVGCVCSECGRRGLTAYDHCERTVRDFPVYGRRSYLVFMEARVDCPDCGVHREKLSWLDPCQRQTVRYEKYVALLCGVLPALDVAELEGLDKSTVYRLDKKWLRRRFDRRMIETVRHLGIDEIAIKKGHCYATVFYDLETRKVLGLRKTRRERAVGGFFRSMGRSWCRKVEAVCMDLWRAFHNAVRRHLPNAVIVFDKFHVFTYLSKAIDDVRKDEQKQADKAGRILLKGARWLLLKNHVNLRRKQKQRLRELLELNENLLTAHLLKEEFAAFYQCQNAAQATLFLEQWISACQESGLKPFLKFAKQIERWKDGLLAYFQFPITNGVSEGINNKIKVLKRRAYGFHDFDYFSLKILNATGALPSLESITHCF